MRLKLLLAALFAMLLTPAVAQADVTAIYSAGKDELRIEARENGDFRFSVGESFSILRIGGVDYVAARDKEKKMVVTRLEGVLAIIQMALKAEGAKGPDGAMLNVESEEMGPETVAGFDAVRWQLGPKGEKPLDLAVSADPQLQPVAKVLRALLALIAPITDGTPLQGNMIPEFDRIFATGAPVRMDQMMTIKSVETGTIDAARFALPGAEISAIDFITAVDFKPPTVSGGSTEPMPELP